MGQFKPMVKMMTTEPSIELKLKKGGTVKKMQMGGLPSAAPAAPAMPATGGSMPAAAPKRPSLMARRRAMMAMPSAAAPAAPVGMAGRLMKEGGESKSEHKAEMKKMSGLEKELKSHESKPASKAHAGLKTGGVVYGQGGFKKGGKVAKYAAGGIIKSEKGETMMHTATVDHSPAKTGGVKLGNGGGYATGGVAKANGGGYKKGGAAKKAYATGGVVDSGAPVAMPQGRKKPSSPVSISKLSGTFRSGGRVTPAEGRLLAAHEAENATAMKQAKAYSNEVYSKYGRKMADGGAADAAQTDKNQRAYENWEKLQTQDNERMRESILSFPKKVAKGVASLFSSAPPAGSVTKTEKSVTVTPGKKRGGSVKC
jgi:hypothetical protein